MASSSRSPSSPPYETREGGDHHPPLIRRTAHNRPISRYVMPSPGRTSKKHPEPNRASKRKQLGKIKKKSNRQSIERDMTEEAEADGCYQPDGTEPHHRVLEVCVAVCCCIRLLLHGTVTLQILDLGRGGGGGRQRGWWFVVARASVDGRGGGLRGSTLRRAGAMSCVRAHRLWGFKHCGRRPESWGWDDSTDVESQVRCDDAG